MPNVISHNNNVNAPVAAEPHTPVGIGVFIDGGQFDTVKGNEATGNGSWGVMGHAGLRQRRPARAVAVRKTPERLPK
jgi:hypothetical protein